MVDFYAFWQCVGPMGLHLSDYFFPFVCSLVFHLLLFTSSLRLGKPGFGGLSFGASLVSEAWWCFIGSSLSSPFLRHFVHPSLLVLGWVSPSFLSASSLESLFFQSFSCSSILHFLGSFTLAWQTRVEAVGFLPGMHPLFQRLGGAPEGLL